MHFLFRIQLANVKDPSVWRELSVPASFSFYRFHLAIQGAFGWDNCHLYSFYDKRTRSAQSIGEPSDEDWEEVIDSEEIKLSDIFRKTGQKYIYLYDFGDGWEHNITLRFMLEDTARKAVLTAGKGACPPEDCGGPWGYENLKKVLANPKDPDYEDMREWLGLEKGATWNAAAFDLQARKEAVKMV